MRWLYQQQLKFGNAKVRLQAIEKLGRDADKSSVASLAIALKDDSREVRKAALECLSKINESSATDVVLQALNDVDTEIRETAAIALRNSQRADVVLALQALLQDSVASVRWHALKSLEAQGWQPSTDELKAVSAVAGGNLPKAAAIGPLAVNALECVLLDSTAQNRHQAVAALGSIGNPKAVKIILSLVGDRDLKVRCGVLECLVELNDINSLKYLIEALDDPSNQVCTRAAELLSRFKDPAMVSPLIKTLKHDHWEARLSAVRTLGKLGDPSALPAVAEKLKDSDNEVREAAVGALEELGDVRAIPSLVAALKDEHERVRSLAGAALRHLNANWERSELAHKAIPELRAALKHKEYWVRQAAADALVRIGESRPVDPLLAGLENPGQTRRNLLLEALTELINDADIDLRLAAVECLKRTGDTRGLGMLVGAMADTQYQVSVAAAKALHALNWQPTTETHKIHFNELLNPLKNG